MHSNHLKILIFKVLFSLFIISMVIASVVIATLLTKAFFAGLLWLVDGEFDMTWNDVLRGIKLGSFGGGILGGGIVLLRLFKVKGF